MAWMEETEERRSSPKALWPEVRSVVMLGLNYGPESDPMQTLGERDRATISVYARGRDYHDLVKGRLKTLAAPLARLGEDVKVFVDTAPVMEKPLAAAAGIGWQGKHTILVSRDFGNWLFLGALYTTAPLQADAPERDHCGSCRRCLDICPTDAFPAPYRLDARRCIAYLTIEHQGVIAEEFRKPMGNRVYGCDDCLAVCPWNKFAQKTTEEKLTAKEGLEAPALSDLLRLDDAAFRTLFAGTPVKRTGRDRFLRNVLIAAGNSGDESLVPEVLACLADPAPLVRGMAVWALSQLAPDALAREAHRAGDESDDEVLAEWRLAAQSKFVVPSAINAKRT